MVLNPFVNFEQSKGKTLTETEDRTFNQIAVDGVYRFGAGDSHTSYRAMNPPSTSMMAPIVLADSSDAR